MIASLMLLGVGAIASPAGAVVGTYGVDDYPDKDATDCSATFGIYSWCKGGTWLSPRKFGYRNCTDFVAWRLGITYSSLAFPGGDGNARGWKQGAINSGYAVGSTPVIGAVAWWGTEVGSGFGHVAIVIGVNADGSARVEQYNQAGTGVYSISASVRADAYLYIGVDGSGGGGGSLPDGTFVSYAGNVYRMAGGAPIYVSTWAIYGGAQPTTALTAAQFASLRQYPADGTFVSTSSGYVYRFAGGAPLYVSSWNDVGGPQSAVLVDQFTIDQAGNGAAPFGHVAKYPANGTFIATSTGSVFRFAGGAPLYVSSWSAVGGPQPATQVSQSVVDTAGLTFAPYGHVATYPADGTFLYASGGGVFRVAGGAPLFVSNWAAVGGSQPGVVVDEWDVDNTTNPAAHLRTYPADGTFVATSASRVYRFAGGAALLISDWAPLGGAQSTTLVDQWDMDNAGSPASHVAPSPADGTVVLAKPSNLYYLFQSGRCAPDPAASSAAVAVNDSSVSCAPPLVVTTSALLDAAKGKAYAAVLTATGGTTPYSWSVASGSLPPGLTLSANSGEISGTATTFGTYSFMVGVTDAGPPSQATTRPYTLKVGVVAVTTASVPDGYVAKAYPSTTLKAVGGSGIYTWSLVSGSLPAGLKLGSGGGISGTPTTVGSSSFTVQAKDGSGTVATWSYSMVIHPMTITTTSLPDAPVGSAYAATLIEAGGKSTWSWSISSGSLPAGLTMSSAGKISGTPTATGTSTFTVRVQDSSTPTKMVATKQLTLTVSPMTIVTSTLPDGLAGKAYASTTLKVSGGKATYAWSIASGGLPAGLVLSASGAISGTPVGPGTSIFTVKVTDGSVPKYVATKQLTITIAPMTITTASLPTGKVKSLYPSTTLKANGGKGTLVWSIVSGSLPPGLKLASGGGISGTPTAAGTYTITFQVADASVPKNIATKTLAITISP